jgi:hypothetical protein
MKFYDLKDKKYVTVDDAKVKYRIIKVKGTKRKLAEAVCPSGHKLSKFVKM